MILQVIDKYKMLRGVLLLGAPNFVALFVAKPLLWIFFGVYFFVWGLAGCNNDAHAGEKHDLLKTNNGISSKDTTIKGWKFRANSKLKKNIKNGEFLYVYDVNKEFANQGLTSEDCPIMAFSVAEDELRAMDVPPLVGHLACWNYYQSIDTPANNNFVKDFKDFCEKTSLPGGADRVTDDPIEAAYFGVYVWKAAVEKAGSFEVDKVREAVYGLEFDAPGGKKKMHKNNQHTLKPVYVGEILANGQFDIVWQSEGLVSPDSYSSYLHPDGDYPAPTPNDKFKELSAKSDRWKK